MSMQGQVIGKSLPNGFAGDFSRQPDNVIDTHVLGGTANLKFGAPVVYSSGKVVEMGASNVAGDFVGVALTGIKSATSYANQNTGEYEPSDPVAVMKRGCCLVKCQDGTPALAGDVYVRKELNPAKTTCVIGGFECADDTYTPADATDPVSRMIKLTNVQWKTAKDANGIAEIRILSCNKA